MQTATELARMFAEQAGETNRSKTWGDGFFVWLTKRQADWLADLLRKEDLAYRIREGFGLVETEQFRPVKRGSFWALLDHHRRASGAAKLYYRWKRKITKAKRGI